MLIKFDVLGKPAPAGSKNAYVPLDKRLTSTHWPRGMPYADASGRCMVNVVDSNQKDSNAWKAKVVEAARQAYSGPLLECAVSVHMLFVLCRPVGHFGTGRNAGKVKDSARKFPTVKPDVLKLARGTEDALTGVIWKDDSANVSLALEKRYSDVQGFEGKVILTISPLDDSHQQQTLELEPVVRPPF